MVHICRGDADTKIISTASELSKGSNVIVVVDDADAVVMLSYHYQNQTSDIYFLQERGKKCWSIKEALKEVTCKEHLLFIHAWSGCDIRHQYLKKGKWLSWKWCRNQRMCSLLQRFSAIIGQPGKKLEKHLWRFLLRCMVVQRNVCWGN